LRSNARYRAGYVIGRRKVDMVASTEQWRNTKGRDGTTQRTEAVKFSTAKSPICSAVPEIPVAQFYSQGK